MEAPDEEQWQRGDFSTGRGLCKTPLARAVLGSGCSRAVTADVADATRAERWVSLSALRVVAHCRV